MSKVNVLISDKYHPEKGLKPFHAEEYKNLVEQLNRFHDGAITPADIACEIIESLFDSEFSYDKKWDVDCACASLVSRYPGYVQGQSFPVAFDSEKRATYDHKDIYSVAKAHAKIVFLSNELIHIELYSYYVSG